jgi:hypothetical protein
MIKRILRLLAFALIAFAIYTLFTQNGLTLGAFWAKNHFKSLQIIQPHLVTVLLAPLWLVSGILGAILLPFGLRRDKNHV